VEVAAADGAGGRPTLTVFRPRPTRGRISVQRKGGACLVSGRSVEEVVARTDLDNPTAVARMRRQLEAAGLRQALLSAEVKAGDTVIVAGLEFTFDPDL